ncbi:MAG: hypothetical protein AAF192_22125 [Pseudomonadota bacterium]
MPTPDDADLARLRALVEAPDDAAVLRAYALTLGDQATGDGWLARARRSLERKLADLRPRLCGHAATRAILSDDGADVQTIASVLLVAALEHGERLDAAIAIAAAAARLGLRRYCAGA